MDSSTIFKALKDILCQYESDLSLLHDKPDHYYLNTKAIDDSRKSEFFGAVQIKKSYVAFHLMPVYYYPELLETISQELKSKMQGKSCFNFKNTDDVLFSQLSQLTRNAFGKYKAVDKV